MFSNYKNNYKKKQVGFQFMILEGKFKCFEIIKIIFKIKKVGFLFMILEG
jgi:hypothetical protein